MSYIQIYPKESQIENEAYPMPWRSDACCYNFHTPKIFIPDDSISEMITDPLDVETLVVTSDLKDYGFISEMENLTQLYLYQSRQIYDLGFLEKLVKLSQILIAHSSISDLKSLATLILNKKKAYETAANDFEARMTYGVEGIYIHSRNRRIEQQIMNKHGVYIGELIINGKQGRMY